MNTKGVVNTCCMPYNQGKGGDVLGTCPKSGVCALVVSTKGLKYTSGGVVSSTSSSPFLGCDSPPSKGVRSKLATIYKPGKS